MQTHPEIHQEAIRQVPEGFTPTKFRIPVPFVELVGPTWMRVLPDGTDPGAWVEARARVERKGRSMIFSSCNFYVGDEKIGHASAVMKITSVRPQP
jgi:hypothetical protein